MRIYSVKPKFQKILEGDKKLLVKMGVGPTAINIAALIVSIFAGLVIFYSDNDLRLLYFIPLLAFVRIAFNALDGMVARETKAKNQKFGEVMNEFVDRLSDCAFFLGLAFVSYVNMSWALLTLIAVLLVSYLGIVGKSAGGSRQYVGLMGKADRMFWLSVACILTAFTYNTAIMNLGLLFIFFFSIVTIIWRFLAIKKELYQTTKRKR
jgi:CDP-diacylglycerol--glycerol-3-phosphate 3-phosphatidyltransferase